MFKYDVFFYKIQNAGLTKYNEQKLQIN